MSIVKHITGFLKTKGSVTVPGFGKFFLQNSQAKFEEETGSILPPAKETGFNIDYEAGANPALLSLISSNENISVEEAEAELKKQTDYWKKQLTENDELIIEGLGKFRKAESDIKFTGERVETSVPDFYGLEQIDLKNLKKTSVQSSNSEGDYRFNRTILWIFLLVIPIAGLAYLAITQKELLFGKKSFNNLSVQTSTHRIKKDTLKLQKARQDSIRLDSLKTDSLKKDSIAKTAVIPVRKSGELEIHPK